MQICTLNAVVYLLIYACILCTVHWRCLKGQIMTHISLVPLKGQIMTIIAHLALLWKYRRWDIYVDILHVPSWLLQLWLHMCLSGVIICTSFELIGSAISSHITFSPIKWYICVNTPWDKHWKTIYRESTLPFPKLQEGNAVGRFVLVHSYPWLKNGRNQVRSFFLLDNCGYTCACQVWSSVQTLSWLGDKVQR